MSQNAVTTAVFPVAGMGTRFLPVTKASPKEMLPIVDRPLIQYVVEEAVAAGIKKIIFVTSYTKRAIEDYFDSNYELESRLQQRGKTALLESLTQLVPHDVTISYVRQNAPRGLGDAILCAQSLVGQQPFAVLLADDIIDANKPCLSGMIERYQQTRGSVLAVENIDLQRSDQYGIVALDADGRVEKIVEKPQPSQAPSSLGVIGRYILTPEIFVHLANLELGVGGELQLTDAIARLLLDEQVTAYTFSGQRYDCGSKEGMLQATLAFAMKRPALRAAVERFFESQFIDI